MIIIGIDPGTHTGLAVWNTKLKRFEDIQTTSIHRALELVQQLSLSAKLAGGETHVYFEDARQRRWFGTADREKLQGAGSVKRDCSIWEDYCTDLGIPFHAVAPKAGMTKITADGFTRLTGYSGRTSEHARDAALLVFGR